MAFSAAGVDDCIDVSEEGDGGYEGYGRLSFFFFLQDFSGSSVWIGVGGKFDD